MGVLPAISGEHAQKAALQSKTAGCDVYAAAGQALVGKQLFLAGLNAFKGGGNMRVELFALRCEAHALGRAEKQNAVQLRFQPLDDPGHIRLVVIESGGSL